MTKRVYQNPRFDIVLHAHHYSIRVSIHRRTEASIYAQVWECEVFEEPEPTYRWFRRVPDRPFDERLAEVLAKAIQYADARQLEEDRRAEAVSQVFGLFAGVYA